MHKILKELIITFFKDWELGTSALDCSSVRTTWGSNPKGICHHSCGSLHWRLLQAPGSPSSPLPRHSCPDLKHCPSRVLFILNCQVAYSSGLKWAWWSIATKNCSAEVLCLLYTTPDQKNRTACPWPSLYSALILSAEMSTLSLS